MSSMNRKLAPLEQNFVQLEVDKFFETEKPSEHNLKELQKRITEVLNSGDIGAAAASIKSRSHHPS